MSTEIEPLLPTDHQENTTQISDIISTDSQSCRHSKNETLLLTARHLNMIVIGGTIGTGVFLGSGQTIAEAGPLGALFAFTLIGLTIVYSVIQSLGEMCSLLPVPGSFNHLAGRFVDSALEFTLGWNYWLQWSVSLRMFFFLFFF